MFFEKDKKGAVESVIDGREGREFIRGKEEGDKVGGGERKVERGEVG